MGYVLAVCEKVLRRFYRGLRAGGVTLQFTGVRLCAWGLPCWRGGAPISSGCVDFVSCRFCMFEVLMRRAWLVETVGALGCQGGGCNLF